MFRGTTTSRKMDGFLSMEMTDRKLTPRDKFILALQRKPITGRVPHVELAFYLTMEPFGKLAPEHRAYHQWGQMEESERQLHRHDMVDLEIAVADRYEHSAIFIHPNPNTIDELRRRIDMFRDKTGDKYFLMAQGDATYEIPDGEGMLDFAYQMADHPDRLKAEADRRVDEALARAETLRSHGGLDGFAMTSDYCLNTGPFLSPSQFSEFVAPFLARLIKGYRETGFYSIKHTDGNMMPIIDQLMECRPDALHSIDPQAGVDIVEVKRRYGNKVCLIGNVNCGLMQTGTDAEVIESVRYALRNGMPGWGYIFSSSNSIYTGMPLSRYELILDVWRKEGNYPEAADRATTFEQT